jgi:hypothetical protein
MNVYQKLQAARIKLQGKQLKKSGHNKFAGYNYFELGDFLPAIQEIFSEVGLCGTVSFDTQEAFLRVTNVDEPTDFIIFASPMSSAALKGCHDVQNLGAVQTYLRRYLWVNTMEIVEHDALDAAEPVKESLDQAKVEEFLTKIKSAKSPDALKKVYTEAYTYAKSDKSAADEVIAAKDKRKSELAIEMQGQA